MLCRPLLTGFGAGCRNRTCLVSLKRRVHKPSLPVTPAPQKTWCRMLESNQHLAIIDRGLDLRANPAWCAVRELNPHLLSKGFAANTGLLRPREWFARFGAHPPTHPGVDQLFCSVERSFEGSTTLHF